MIAPAGIAPDVSVIIPVLGEEALINGVIARIREISARHSVEIIVVDGDRGGTTVNAVVAAEPIRLQSPPGRARQMNRGAAAASGGTLLFLHADTFLPAGAFGRIVETIRSGRCRAGAFGLGIDSRRPSIRLIAAAARLRMRFTGIPFGDQAIFMKRDYFDAIGGYADIPLMEDVELMRRIKKRGGGIEILPERVATSARKWERDGVLFSVLRNWSLQLAYRCGVAPERLAGIYYREKAHAG